MKYILTNRLGSFIMMVFFTLIFTAGCNDLFEVENLNTLEEEQLENPNQTQALSNSAEGALSEIYSFSVVMGEMPADGMITATTAQEGTSSPDKGLFDNVESSTEELWNELAAARWTTTEVTRRLENMVDNPESNIGLARNYFWDSIARITLADLFNEIPFDNGPPNTPIEVYEDAINRLIKANEIAQAATNTEESTKYAAASYGSIARAYRSLYFERDGDFNAFEQAAEYAQMALEVDPTFYIEIRYQLPGMENELYRFSNIEGQQVMGPDYAYLRDPVSDERDPRIEHSPFQDIGGIQQDSIYNQLKYPNSNANIPVSRWQEAELILAEYSLLQDDLTKAVEHINRVRNSAGLSSFASSDFEEIKTQIIYERKAEFWLELRRWQDMRYYNIIPDRWTLSAQEKGVDRRYNVSVRERNANPHL